VEKERIMLEPVFSGKTRLAALLIELFGGAAELKIAREGGYETRSLPYVLEKETSSEGASPTPGGRTWETNALSNGLRRLERSFRCFVPSSYLDAEPRVGVDVFRAEGRDYAIEEVEIVRVGAAAVLYKLTCASR
jgi:hypothetical protein